jgi:Fe-S-cluster containining protein
MTPDELLSKNHSPESIEAECRNSLERLLREIHSPAALNDLWPVIRANAVYQELSENWLSWTESYQKREWEALCREMEKAAYATRPYCLRCGDCCRQGSPTLYLEDLPILRQGIIRRLDLLTLRAGEIGFSNVSQDLVLLDEEQVKVKEKPGSRECLFLESGTGLCGIYENRPLQCRVMECWNPDLFYDQKAQKNLTRQELLNPDDSLVPIIESHSKRCSLDDLQKALTRAQRGFADAQEEALDILFFDQHLREYLDREQRISPENQVFLIGRPVSDLIRSFGFCIEEDSGGRLKLVINDQASLGNHRE